MNDSGYEHSSARKISQPMPVYGDRRDNGSCFWKILFAVILTAAITFALTAGGAYMLYLRSAMPVTGTTDPEHGMRISTAAAPQEGLQFSNDPETVEALQKLVDVYNILKDNYYEDLSEAELLEKMAMGLTNSMDSQYTYYLTKEVQEMSEESMSGEYSGIGAVVEEREPKYFRITDLIPGSPALEAGLRIGDVIESVSGQSASEFQDVSHLASVIRGAERSSVTIGVYRESDGSRFELTIERRKITNANTRHRMLTDAIGYIQVTEFSHNVSRNFIKAIDELVDKGAKRLVIDLRNNGGGLADECVKMADYLAGDQVVATIEGRRDGRDFSLEWTSDAKVGVPDDMSYVILLNNNSASASELFSGALHDYGKAVLVGEQTFGKGVGTLTYVLSDGSAIQVTNFEYFLPNGESIQDVGLTPDVSVELSEEAAGLPITMMSEEQDTQLARAVEILEESLE